MSDKIKNDLYHICEEFINSHQITCPESISQSDAVIIDAYNLIENICDTIGYFDYEE